MASQPAVPGPSGARSRSALVAVALAMVGLAVGCGGGDGSGAGTTAATKPTTTAKPPAGQLKTDLGTLQISKVASPKQYQDSVPKRGFRFLAITLRPAAGQTVSTDANSFSSAAKSTEVRGSEGGSGSPAITSVKTAQGKSPTFELIFTVKASGRDHKLIWPDNPPVDLAEFK